MKKKANLQWKVFNLYFEKRQMRRCWKIHIDTCRENAKEDEKGSKSCEMRLNYIAEQSVCHTHTSEWVRWVEICLLNYNREAKGGNFQNAINFSFPLYIYASFLLNKRHVRYVSSSSSLSPTFIQMTQSSRFLKSPNCWLTLKGLGCKEFQCLKETRKPLNWFIESSQLEKKL